MCPWSGLKQRDPQWKFSDWMGWSAWGGVSEIHMTIVNPFTAPACEMAKRCTDAPANSIFSATIRHLPSLYTFWWKSFHMPMRKRRQKVQNLHFYWPFSSEIMAVKGLIRAEWKWKVPQEYPYLSVSPTHNMRPFVCLYFICLPIYLLIYLRPYIYIRKNINSYSIIFFIIIYLFIYL